MKIEFRKTREGIVEVLKAGKEIALDRSLGTLYKEPGMDGWAADGSLETVFGENIADGSTLHQYKKVLKMLARELPEVHSIEWMGEAGKHTAWFWKTDSETSPPYWTKEQAERESMEAYREGGLT